MIVSLLLSLGLAVDPAPAAPVYNGRDSALAVAIPRLDATIAVDGALDETSWQQAARLTGFSQFAPVDGRPAEYETTILVWYSPNAIYFGVRAVAPQGSVRATLADRDKLDEDDTIEIYLSTFNDTRQAFVFGVNPLGVQMDGALVEGANTQGSGFSGMLGGRELPDLTQDFVYQSKGRVTPDGYEIEIRIPFKSLRYQADATQNWRINVVRKFRETGREDTWTPAVRSANSFLAQSGTLQGLTDLKRGLVLDLNPVVISKIDGAPNADSWTYDAGAPEFGGNVRWGVTSNLTLNGTINPDFSQVESDASQISPDPRLAIFYPEKRPFFLDGIEQFSTPSNLIYTRRVVAPLGAAKLTGKVSGTSVAVLSAVDDTSTSASGTDHPYFTIARVQRDLGAQSKLGFVYTDRIDGDEFNRVAGIDSRLAFRDLYALQLQSAFSWTREQGTTTAAPLWQARFTRNGRVLGMRYFVKGIDEDFRADSGFIARGGIAEGQIAHQLTYFGPAKSLLERWSTELNIDYMWTYQDFKDGKSAQDRKYHLNNNATLKGGWQLGGSVLYESFGFDEELYSDYALASPRADGGVDILPFVGTPRLTNLDYVLTLNTPPRGGLSVNVLYLWGRDENFFEWSSADIIYATAGVQWRPTEKLRVDGDYQIQNYDRRSDGTHVGSHTIPRLKVEYQLSRSIFLRVVTEYDLSTQDTLRDDGRTELPIWIRDSATGEYEPAVGFRQPSLRTDWLFSYQPTPGTVIFAGYGSSLDRPDQYGRLPLQRASDGFFLKASYLFRL